MFMRQLREALGCAARVVTCALLLAFAQISATTAAEGDSAATAYTFDIPAGPLARVLTTFAEVTNANVAYTPELVRGLQSGGVSGRRTAEAALGQLLRGTGLIHRYVQPNAFTIEKVSGAGRARTLGPVRVEGTTSTARNGWNGSRDPTTTEGSGSYTSDALTVGSKTAESMRDTPQAVSVITQERLRDQNITTFDEAMKQAPGLTVAQGVNSGTNLDFAFYSRGFEITSLQLDGGAPIMTTAPNLGAFGYFPIIDMAQFDHVEVLRGAAGLFNGYGNPSGSVNLVRKKPLDHNQVALEIEAGSWQRYRAVLDASGPLGFDDRLRGRAVLSYQDNNHFYDIASENRTLGYGVLEYDVTPATLITAGLSYLRQDSVPWSFGLPRFQNGNDLGLPRDTCLCFPWNRWNFRNTEVFATAEQRLGSDWSLKLNLTRNQQTSDRKQGISSGSVNPLTGAGTVFAANRADFASDQRSGELTLAGAFDVLGQRQRVVAGFNYANNDSGGYTIYPNLVLGTAANPYTPYPGGPQYYTGSPNGPAPPIDVFHFNPNGVLYTEPRDVLASQRYQKRGQVQSGAYVNVTLTAFDKWHLTTGSRYSWYKYDVVSDQLCTTATQAGCTGNTIGLPAGPPIPNPSVTRYTGHDFSWPPSVSVSYDVTSNLSAFVGYTDIYVSQARNVDRDLEPLDPITGANVEAGLKWESAGGKLNASVTGYRIEQHDFAMLDPSALVVENRATYYVDNKGNRYLQGASTADGQHLCCYIIGANSTFLSRGVDAELSGELAPGWQASFGYTWNKNEKKGSANGTDPLTGEGTPLVARQPQHLLKLWSTYSIGGVEWLRGLSVGGGVNAQSKAYVAGTACTVLNPPNAFGTSTCKTSVPYAFTQKSYAVWSARVAYDLGAGSSLALNVENLTDKRYYQTIGTSQNGNWYGDPRSVALTFRRSF